PAAGRRANCEVRSEMKTENPVAPVVAIRLSDETIALKDGVREFAEREVRPVARERDLIADPLEAFPWDAWRKASQEGLRTLALPAEFGGIGMDVLTHCVILEELC